MKQDAWCNERDREAGVFDYTENWLGEGRREMARPFRCQFSVDLMDVYEYQMEEKNQNTIVPNWKVMIWSLYGKTFEYCVKGSLVC
jgi:hypothetical protein